MPLRLQDIANYKTKKFVVENATSGIINIGDLKITLRKNEAQDLLAQNQFTKRPVREFEQIAASRDLELLIVLGKVNIYDDNGLVNTTAQAINLSDFADAATGGAGGGSSGGSGVQIVSVSDITDPTELGSEEGTESGQLVLAVQDSPFAYTLYTYTTGTVTDDNPHVVAASGSGTWLALSGEYMRNANMGNYVLLQPQIAGFSEKFVDLGSVSGNVDLDVSQGNIFKVTITGATTLDIMGMLPGDVAQSIVLYIENGSTNVTFADNILWPEGNVPSLDVAGIDRLAFQTIDNGTNWYAISSGSNFL